jgi:hypothetical protein
MNHAPPIDIVTVAIAIATALFGRDVAAVVGPYAVIVLGALLGAAWSASRREPSTPGSTLGHMVMMVGLALLVTVPIAAVAGQYAGLESKWLLGPVAVVIAGIGQDWHAVASWAVGRVRALVDRRAGSGESQQ